MMSTSKRNKGKIWQDGRIWQFGVAFAPFVGFELGVYLFGKVSMAHFNPAVTLGFLITKHITKRLVILYVTAEITGAFLGSLFVRYVIGSEAFLGANSPNYAYPLPLIFGVEVLASALLMAVILVVVHKKGLRGFGGILLAGLLAWTYSFWHLYRERQWTPRVHWYCFIFWSINEPVAQLDSHIYWHIYGCGLI